MAKTKQEIIEDIKIKRPDLTEEQCIEYFETLSTFCELVINYTIENSEMEYFEEFLKL
jgi:hypothetical protein